MLKEITEKVRTPRALAVPFALGYPLGLPGDRELQTRILRAAFALLDLPGPPPVTRDFDDPRENERSSDSFRGT